MVDGDAAFGDTLINYRYQALMEGPGRPAFSPRVSLILPTGDASDAATDSTGLQVNLPFSKQTGDVYWHWNAGFTWLPRPSTERRGSRQPSMSPFLAGSAIYRLRPMFNLMLENVLRLRASCPTGVGTVARQRRSRCRPASAAAGTSAITQLILGAAVPITWADGEDATTGGVLLSVVRAAVQEVTVSR